MSNELNKALLNYPNNIWRELPKGWPCKCQGCSMGGGVHCIESGEKYGYLIKDENQPERSE